MAIIRHTPPKEIAEESQGITWDGAASLLIVIVVILYLVSITPPLPGPIELDTELDYEDVPQLLKDYVITPLDLLLMAGVILILIALLPWNISGLGWVR